MARPLLQPPRCVPVYHTPISHMHFADPNLKWLIEQSYQCWPSVWACLHDKDSVSGNFPGAVPVVTPQAISFLAVSDCMSVYRLPSDEGYVKLKWGMLPATWKVSFCPQLQDVVLVATFLGTYLQEQHDRCGSEICNVLRIGLLPKYPELDATLSMAAGRTPCGHGRRECCG